MLYVRGQLCRLKLPHRAVRSRYVMLSIALSESALLVCTCVLQFDKIDRLSASVKQD